MKKSLVVLAIMAMVLSVATTALAEHGTIDPFGVKARGRISAGNGTIQPLEHGTIDPF